VKTCTVRRAPAGMSVDHGWEHPAWSAADTLEIDSFRPEGSGHRPRTRARLLHGDAGLFGIFHVADRHIRCVHRTFQDPVYEDSCVEVFLQPKPDRGYVNLEMSCGGAILMSHVTDERRTRDGFAAYRKLREDEGRQVLTRGTTAPIVEPEIEGPLDWEMAFFVPTAVLEGCVGPIGPLAGQEWRANLYKCGDKTSHPHWAAWSPVDALNFHLPRCFGVLRFEA
jgi:hypothetical protein